MLISNKQLSFQFRHCSVLRSQGRPSLQLIVSEVLLKTVLMTECSWENPSPCLLKASLPFQSPLTVGSHLSLSRV